MQLDVPTGAPGVFFIDNVGKAYSYGLETELTARPVEPWEIFTGLSLGHARFEEYIQPSGASAAGHALPFAPVATWNAGTQYTLHLNRDLYAYARGEFLLVSEYNYDASAAQAQDLYTLTNFRVGLGGRFDALGGAVNWRLEGYVDNAFDTVYVPLAFPFALAPSGYVGENGAPRTYGVRLSLGF
jgi:iron complex outermembrane receptor protein